mmetsp:Transcript_49555/g.155247  ORF Transcript_49555/g.155247 Transcript_49555/m.155247 type:complete len:227 (+) Transcript_49555:792-1472(+)
MFTEVHSITFLLSTEHPILTRSSSPTACLKELLQCRLIRIALPSTTSSCTSPSTARLSILLQSTTALRLPPWNAGTQPTISAACFSVIHHTESARMLILETSFTASASRSSSQRRSSLASARMSSSTEETRNTLLSSSSSSSCSTICTLVSSSEATKGSEGPTEQASIFSPSSKLRSLVLNSRPSITLGRKACSMAPRRPLGTFLSPPKRRRRRRSRMSSNVRTLS